MSPTRRREPRGARLGQWFSSLARRPLRLLVATLALLVVSFALLLRVTYRTPSEGRAESLDRVYALAQGGQIPGPPCETKTPRSSASSTAAAAPKPAP